MQSSRSSCAKKDRTGDCRTARKPLGLHRGDRSQRVQEDELKGGENAKGLGQELGFNSECRKKSPQGCRPGNNTIQASPQTSLSLCFVSLRHTHTRTPLFCNIFFRVNSLTSVLVKGNPLWNGFHIQLHLSVDGFFQRPAGKAGRETAQEDTGPLGTRECCRGRGQGRGLRMGFPTPNPPHHSPSCLVVVGTGQPQWFRAGAAFVETQKGRPARSITA